MNKEKLIETTGDWQVKVEVYETYVLKTPKTLAEIKKQISKSKWATKLSDKKLQEIALQAQQNHLVSIDLISKKKVPPELLGNPIFYPNNSIKQDKVIMLTEVLSKKATININEAKEIINKYFQLNIDIWKYGLFEASFNFSLNNGIDNKGNVIFVDLGEFSDDFSKVHEYLKKEMWLKCWSFKEDLHEELKEYFFNKAKEFFSIESLKKHWNTISS